MSGTLYWVAYPTSQPDPSDTQVVLGSSWPGAITGGNAPAIETSGVQTFPSVAIAFVGSYKVAFVFYDGATYSNVSISAPVEVTEADLSYPRWVQTIQSSEALEDSIQFERSSNGTLHARVLWGSPARVFNLQHILTKSEMEHLDSFYITKRGHGFTFVWGRNNMTYTTVFRTPPSYTQLGANLFDVRVTLETL